MALNLAAGVLLGRYRLLRRLGVGGMGEVWAAQDTSLEREVAVKVASQLGGLDDEGRERFRREALVLARLAHPNVVKVYDVGSLTGSAGEQIPFLVMELVRGESFAEEVRRGPLPPRRAVAVLEQVARALAAAHRAGVVHRDLKPSNVLIGEEDHVSVVDFGLARLLEKNGVWRSLESLTTSGVVLGSCAYMAPEQASGGRAVPASDVFSCGVMLYEALAGVKPFNGANPVAVLRQVVEGRYTPLGDVMSDVPPALTAVVDQCLARDPERRYRNGTALHDELVRLREELEVATSLSPTRSLTRASVQALRQRRRRRFLTWAAMAMGVTALVGSVGVYLGRIGWERGRPEPGTWEVRQVFGGPGWVQAPDFNPRGSAIAFEHNLGETAEILVLELDDSTPRVVARAVEGAVLARPRFSPDGRRLALTFIASGTQEVRILPATGGAVLATIPSADHATWLDDDRVLFTRPAGARNAIWVYHLASGVEEQFVTPGGDISWWEAKPRPGGGLALLGGASDIAVRVFVMGSPGEDPRPWTAAPRSVTGYAWTPDGRAMVASIGGQLYLLGDRSARRLLPEVTPIGGAALSPDGRTIAWTRREAQTDLVAFSPGRGDVRCVLCGVRNAGWGSVGPGGVIAYRRQDGQSRRLVLRSPSGEERLLSPPDEDASCPSFSPDGLRVAYQVKTPTGTELRAVAVTGGESVLLAEGVEPAELPSWSPDGRFIAYAAGDPVNVWVVSAGGAPPRQVTTAGGDYPVWSPDGRWIAYVVWTDVADPAQGAWVVPAAGGKPRQVSRYPTALAWSPQGDALWQVRRGRTGLELWSATPGEWQFRRLGSIPLPSAPAVHAEHLPLSVDPTTGELILVHRSFYGELMLFQGADPRRW